MPDDDLLGGDWWDRIARALWHGENLEPDGSFWPTSSDEVEAILKARIRELEAELAARRHVPRARAWVQELQLELIRGTNRDELEGERVYRDLLARRDAWLAVLLDCWSPPEDHGLIKLRDLPLGIWNVDTLFVLARDDRAARQLARRKKAWRADEVHVHGREATRGALGGGVPSAARLVTFWWD